MSLLTANRDKSRATLLAGAIILLSLCLLTVLSFTPYASLLEFAYPAVVVVIGGWLYISNVPLYLGFVWWIWFTTPFVRRLIDYELGAHNPRSPVILSSFLVTGFCLFTVFRYGKLLKNRPFVPLLLAIFGVLYGYLVGLVKVGILSATFALLQWLLPLLLAAHVLLFWRLYPQHRRVLRSTFTWGVLVMGTYATIQYLFAPPWDMQWLIQSGMTGSMGQPEPMQFRLFSTLNSTGPFARTMMVGLVLLFAARGTVSRIAAAPGYFSLLLSLVRAAWGAWFVGVLVLVAQLQGTLRKRLLAILGLSVLISLPLFIFAPSTGRVQDRADTLTSLNEDASFRARIALHGIYAPRVLTNPIGTGIGNFGTAAKLSRGDVFSFDSGLLEVPMALGWPGSILYLGGLIWMLWHALSIRGAGVDPFPVALVAAAVALLSMMVFANQLKGNGGLIIWSFLALSIAARRYHHADETSTT